MADRDGRIVRNVSRSVWIWNVPGVSAVGRIEKVSSGEMASAVAVRRPILSQLRYLFIIVFFFHCQ